MNGETGDTLTYVEVDLATRHITTGLHNIGICQGDVIMLVLRNCPKYSLAFLSASHCAVITTANHFYTPLELANQAAAIKTRAPQGHYVIDGLHMLSSP
ncbi:hypothetical protein VNO80_15948 [Phaseolus coccineus]|uniref:AMP-dependent synthetase/ligase domain-containing protein n=1 Tax=Phaseolus coccineus TaxID=3886 RepID=A0AAN9R7G3_PHACN